MASILSRKRTRLQKILHAAPRFLTLGTKTLARLSVSGLCCVLLATCAPSRPSQDTFSRQLLRQKGLVAFWDFGQASEQGFSDLTQKKLLRPASTTVKQVQGGPLSGFSVELDGKQGFLSIPHANSGNLDIKTNQVTVMGWVKWEGGTGFVAGKWNEYTDGGKRQYGLFVSLPHYNGGDQVCGHISKNGGPTPPFPYSIDYSASPQTVPKSEWVCVAFTYDGTWIKSYLNGKFETREPERIKHTQGFLPDKPDGLIQSKNPYHYPDGMGLNQSDFTVGGVQLKKGMGNFFKGRIGGIAVFDRALTASEMEQWAVLPKNFEP
jgi:hypothetical protein